LIKRIFISKELTELAHLPAFCAEHSIELIAKACIEFSAVPFEVKNPYDVVFFGSIRASNFFLQSQRLTNKVEIACIGETTAKKLQELNLAVSFIGKKAGTPIEVAKEFKMWLGHRSVLFPISSVSKESIVKMIPEEQAEKIVVYETLPKVNQIKHLDLAVFTSPSNFESFVNAGNAIPKNTIAWGNTTSEAMNCRKIQANITLETSTESELITALQCLITQ
jgi:uroporphyrinogen-III synthase